MENKYRGKYEGKMSLMRNRGRREIRRYGKWEVQNIRRKI
jgi:hypothetical protein